MPTIPLAVARQGPDLAVDDLRGGVLDVPRPQFRCLLEVPGFILPVDAIVDTGAPLSIFPSRIWTRFQSDIDYELLPYVGPNPPPARVAGWQFDFHIARFLVPLALLDSGLATRAPRTGVVAKFAVSDPPG